MTKPALFFAHLCPDTEPFVAELARLNVDYESVNILESMANYKRFLFLRDRHSAFDHAKQNSHIGIPALLLANERVVLDKDDLSSVFK
ncbi:hypothetical protein HT665_05730 [Ursidibacter maritimus]|uniref:Glutaredoxin-related protein n=1 Tax=Ursidibacter maritimus TaxID=1331689 RepID=A0A949WFW6_9PAST|nr:hypothetical protein [Ursidibacter maritimus]KAE9540199.1 hypothetical protein A1D26_03260 [Ursidibacter maritimus]MBV6524344.1 hypothetical protein [Ursidibacter maritimus]MBV6526376.1 hypothetical protein [Ursidibacter maritimus]MBV6527893.1 hypothetical protein [Ursidibacter maritimus]MBV6529154.1 hypothetical protein [Ursidibacter maritimus]